MTVPLFKKVEIGVDENGVLVVSDDGGKSSKQVTGISSDPFDGGTVTHTIAVDPAGEDEPALQLGESTEPPNDATHAQVFVDPEDGQIKVKLRDGSVLVVGEDEGSKSQWNVLTIAASDTVDPTGADFACDGASDQVQIQEALDSLATAGGKGRVQLLDGTFVFDGSLRISPQHSGLGLIGSGREATNVRGDPGDGIPFIDLSQGLQIDSGENDSDPDLTVVDDFGRPDESPLSQGGNWGPVWGEGFSTLSGYAANVMDLVSEETSPETLDPGTLGYFEAASCRTDVDEADVDVAARYVRTGPESSAYDPCILGRVQNPGTSDAVAYVLYVGDSSDFTLYAVGENFGGYGAYWYCRPEVLPLQEGDWFRLRIVDDRLSVFIRRGETGEWERCLFWNESTSTYTDPYITDTMISGPGSVGVGGENQIGNTPYGALDRFAWGSVVSGGEPDPVTETPEILDGFELGDFFLDGQDWVNSTTLTGSSTAFGAILDTGLGVVKKLTCERLKIYTRDINQSGSGIVSQNISENAGSNEDWLVRDCQITTDGKGAYGIKMQKRCVGLLIESNSIIQNKQPTTSSSGDGAYNSIAVYGGCSRFRVANNFCQADGSHSPIAVSPASFGTIVGNIVHLLSAQASEAGIEVQFKADHSDNAETTHDVTVVANVVIGAYWGAVVNNETNTEGMDPYNVLITGNTFSGCTSRDVALKQGTGVAAFGNNHYNSNQEIDTEGVDAIESWAGGGSGVANLIVGSRRNNHALTVLNESGDVAFVVNKYGRPLLYSDEIQMWSEANVFFFHHSVEGKGFGFLTTNGPMFFDVAVGEEQNRIMSIHADGIRLNSGQLSLDSSATPATPDFGSTLFVDEADGLLKVKKANGSVVTVE